MSDRQNSTTDEILLERRDGVALATLNRPIAADALYCGLAKHYVPGERLETLIDALADTRWEAGCERQQVDTVLARFVADAGPTTAAGQRDAIDRCFGGGSVEAIIEALERKGTEWAAATLASLGRMSPTSLKLTFRQLELGASTIEEALVLEYRMTQHVIALVEAYFRPIGENESTFIEA